MKYNFNLKNVQIQNVASVEELEVNVEYSVGEIPEILGHVLPFIERLAGEILPKLADKFVDTRAKLDELDAEKREARAAERIAEQMAGRVAQESSNQEMFSHLLKAAASSEQRQHQPESFEYMLKRRLDGAADDQQKTEQFLDRLDRALEDVILRSAHAHHLHERSQSND